MKWQRLEKHLDPLAGRQRQLRTWRALGACWIAGLLYNTVVDTARIAGASNLDGWKM